MKNYVFGLLFLLCSFAYGQVNYQDATFYGAKTAAERDAISVPSDRVAWLFNSTSGQWEYKIGAGSWQGLSGGGGGGITWGTPVNANITFDADGTYSIGTSSVRANNIYADAFGGYFEALDNSNTAAMAIGSVGLSTSGAEFAMEPAGSPTNSLNYDADTNAWRIGTDAISTGEAGFANPATGDLNMAQFDIDDVATISNTGSMTIQVDSDNNSSNTLTIRDGTQAVMILSEFGVTMDDITIAEINNAGPKAVATKEFVEQATLPSENITYDNTISGLTATTVKAALDELDADIAAVGYDGYSFQNIGTDQTLDNADVISGSSRRWNKVSTNAEVTLDNTITEYGVPFILESTADSVTVLKGTGTTLYVEGQAAAITEDGVSAYTRSPLTVIAESNNVYSVYGNTQNLITISTGNPWLLDGYAGSVGSEANAIYATEAASGVYISSVSTSDATQAVATDSPSGNGTYSIQVTGDDGATDRLNVQVSGLTNGEIYEYEVSYRMVTGSSGRARIRNGDESVEFVQSFSSTSWTTQTGEFTFTNSTNSYIEIDLFAAISGAASDQARFEFDIRLKDD